MDRVNQPADGRAPALTVLGSLNVDLFCRCTRLPSPGETVAGRSLTRMPGGKGANQAVAAARLGGDVRMVGCVGPDSDGQWLREELRRTGMDVTGVRTATQPTGTALITVDEHGENQIVVVAGANAEVDPAAVVDNGGALLTQLEVSTAAVLEAARRWRGFFALNAAPAQRLSGELLERADLIVVNETEYAAIPELSESRLVAVTYGARGATLLQRGVEIASAPAPEVEPVDSVGAGDAFCATLVLALTSGIEAAGALRAACMAGALAVSAPGPQPPLPPLSELTAGVSSLKGIR